MKIRYAAAALLCSLPFSATAQDMKCHPREIVVSYLTTKEGQAQRTVLLTHSGAVLEVWGNDESGTWAVIVSKPDGFSCLLANGVAFSDVEIPPKGVRG